MLAKPPRYDNGLARNGREMAVPKVLYDAPASMRVVLKPIFREYLVALIPDEMSREIERLVEDGILCEDATKLPS